MGKFRFYHIREDYIEYLHTIDYRVQMNKGERRPYIGVVLTLGEHEYYVPLESPKPNHMNIRSGGPVLKLDDGKLGIMGFNNMIPVKRSDLIEFDILSEPDERYKNLLLNQLNYCEKNKSVILARAKATYKKALDARNTFYRKVCCDFKRLERYCKKYTGNNINIPKKG